MSAAVLLRPVRARMAEGLAGPSGLKRVLSTGSTSTAVTTPFTEGEEPGPAQQHQGGGRDRHKGPLHVSMVLLNRQEHTGR
jgi:hypothetical protein